MAHFDVFNGDADGLCSLQQLRLASPLEGALITGTKRDIALLERVRARKGDTVTVLDVSMRVNRPALLALLEKGVSIHYFDHHDPGEVPVHPALQTFIDPAPDTCTGEIVDRWLGGTHRAWAVVAAFGDNLDRTACELARPLQLPAAQLRDLRELGESLNYNAYGDSEADLVIHPGALHAILRPHATPSSFITTEPIFQVLRKARRQDLELAQQVHVHASLPAGKIVILPDAPWSRRVRGAYGNFLAKSDPRHANAIFSPDAQGGYVVSVRAPLATMRGADCLCRRFPQGGGRPAAGGINHLPQDMLPAFIHAFEQAWSA